MPPPAPGHPFALAWSCRTRLAADEPEVRRARPTAPLDAGPRCRQAPDP